MDTPTPIRFRKVSVSVRETQARAVELLAWQEKHGNVSRIYQEALDTHLARELGRSWEKDLDAITTEVSA